jgi:hypothetical protein
MGKFRVMENISCRIKNPIFSPIIEPKLMAVNITKINVRHCRGLNTQNIRSVSEQVLSPTDCDIIKLTKKCVLGFIIDNTSAIAVHMSIVKKKFFIICLLSG